MFFSLKIGLWHVGFEPALHLSYGKNPKNWNFNSLWLKNFVFEAQEIPFYWMDLYPSFWRNIGFCSLKIPLQISTVCLYTCNYKINLISDHRYLFIRFAFIFLLFYSCLLKKPITPFFISQIVHPKLYIEAKKIFCLVLSPAPVFCCWIFTNIHRIFFFFPSAHFMKFYFTNQSEVQCIIKIFFSPFLHIFIE